MNMRCMYCQTMFGVSREVMLVGLQTMEAENLKHHPVYCPKCRRANRVERRKLEMANPNWKETVKKLAKEAAQVEKAQAAVEQKISPAKKKPAAKSKAKPKAGAAKKSAAKKKNKAKKTAAKSKAKPKASAAKKSAAKKTTKAKAK